VIQYNINKVTVILTHGNKETYFQTSLFEII